MSGLSGHLRRIRRTVPQLQNEIAQKVIAVEAQKFHAENFRKKAFQDNGAKQWKPRKDKDTSRALLVKTGRGRRTATSARIQSNTTKFVMPIYMRVHNEGLKAGRGAGFKMPKRQFAGQSRILKSRFKRKAKMIINQRLNKS